MAHGVKKRGKSGLKKNLRYYGLKYKELKRIVFLKDNYTCVKCGSREKIQCHHKIKWNKNKTPEEQRYYNTEGNLETLCFNCHRLIHLILNGSVIL